MDKEPMTLAGYNKITGDLEFLKKTERPETVIALDEARQLGDLKENAEYHSAKEKLGLIDYPEQARKSAAPRGNRMLGQGEWAVCLVSPPPRRMRGGLILTPIQPRLGALHQGLASFPHRGGRIMRPFPLDGGRRAQLDGAAG